jgi:signal transduction histidine kinase
MKSILLLVNHKENRRLLTDWLIQQQYEVLHSETVEGLDNVFDLVILDGFSLDKFADAISVAKKFHQPLFLPVLLITSRQDVGMLTRQLWQVVDELVFSPIEKMELMVRIEVLLRTRKLSLDLRDTNINLAHEITEHQETLDELKIAVKTAEEANLAKVRFLAMISHELRTPLTSIKGFSTTLLARDVDWGVEEQREFIEIIDDEADKLGDLIEQLLDISKIQASVFSVQLEEYLVMDVLQMSLPQLRHITAEHQLVVDVPSDLPPILIDLKRIAQVLVNLVGNAARYSPPGTRIEVTAQLAGDRVQMTVRDEGPGIPLDQREHIFEAFVQLNKLSKASKKGAGLGLAICKGIIDAHGGAIWVHDQAPPGTSVSFTLLTTAAEHKMES